MNLETMLLTVLSIVPGLIIGYWVSAQFMDSFSSDLFAFDLYVKPSTFVFAALAIANHNGPGMMPFMTIPPTPNVRPGRKL